MNERVKDLEIVDEIRVSLLKVPTLKKYSSQYSTHVFVVDVEIYISNVVVLYLLSNYYPFTLTFDEITVIPTVSCCFDFA